PHLISKSLIAHLYTTPTAPIIIFHFFYTPPPTTEIYTLSLHDALPISNRDNDDEEASQYLNAIGAFPSKATLGGWMAANGNAPIDRKSTRLNSSHLVISYAVFCLKKKTNT